MLAWALQNPDAQRIREDYERFGQDIPDDLWPPDFMDGAQSLYNAFWDLSSDRPMGMQPGRIPWASAKAYCDTIPGEDFDLFWRVIRAMDTVYMEHQAEGGKPKAYTKEMFRGTFAK